MTARTLKAARRACGWTQAQAAAKAGVSQPYWSLLESGRRPVPSRLARRFVKVLDLPLTALPLPARLEDAAPVSNDTLAEDLGKLGYPGFAYLRSQRRAKNPALVLLQALALEDLDPRVTEGLPWLLLHYPEFDTAWLVEQAKRHDLQNRLGFMSALASRVAEGHGPLTEQAGPLRSLEQEVLPSKLSREQTFFEPASVRLREWLRLNRTVDAKEWNLLTDWRPEHLQYAPHA